uniref:Vomeronasal 2, receptor 120 n=3 Tax=Mus musculus TaxID=10090 RepID=A0A3Q4EC41_MOUSE
MLIFVSVLLFLNFPVASCEPINPGCSLGMADAIFQDGDVLVDEFENFSYNLWEISSCSFDGDCIECVDYFCFLCLYTGYIQISINM